MYSPAHECWLSAVNIAYFLSGEVKNTAWLSKQTNSDLPLVYYMENKVDLQKMRTGSQNGKR